VWVVRPSCYLDERGDEDPKLRPGTSGLRWACHRDTRAGDLAVLYRSRQAKDLAYLFRAVSDAEADGDVWACEAEVVERLPRPVGLAELRADPVTATWPALRASFVRTAFPVPDDVWERLVALSDSVHG
jgi:predicted RNA-binding protein with PUA-like domain